MKKRKTLAMGLAVAMAVSCLAGCGGDDKGGALALWRIIR